MTWFKVDDKLHGHIKARRAGVAAMGLWAICGSYCADNLTDGFVATDVPALYAGDDASYLAGRLVKAGLWYEVDGGWQFHDWEEYQPSATSVREKRAELAAKRSLAGKKGAQKRWQTDGKPMASAMANAWQTDSPVPVPVPNTNTPPSPPKGVDEGEVVSAKTKKPEPIELDRLPDEEHISRLESERDSADTCPKIREVLDALSEESCGKIQTTCNTEMSRRLEAQVKELGYGIERYQALGEYADPARGNGFKDLRCALNIAFLLGDDGIRLVNALDNSWAWKQKQRKPAPPVRVRTLPQQPEQPVSREVLAAGRAKLAALKAGFNAG